MRVWFGLVGLGLGCLRVYVYVCVCVCMCVCVFGAASSVLTYIYCWWCGQVESLKRRSPQKQKRLQNAAQKSPRKTLKHTLTHTHARMRRAR